ncbi:MAG: hypothetical protein LLG02_10570 [Pelosinus sp.]|nr:hypothetical protein [Pelosinus sp.]
MNLDLSVLWQKFAFIIVHYTSIWLLAAFFGTALASWYLSVVLTKHNNRAREAKLARKTAAAYTVVGGALWLFSFIFG